MLSDSPDRPTRQSKQARDGITTAAKVEQAHHGPDSLSDRSEESKFSMERLCAQFVARFKDRRPGRFESKELQVDDSVKMRRIYELMNILEGCNSVRRIAKGEYEWLGFIDDLREVVPSRKKEETSLSNLAHKVKRMLREAEGEVSIREIERRVQEEHRQKGVQPESIRRRIYECCKVLRILGFVKKDNMKNYKWVPSNERKYYTEVTVSPNANAKVTSALSRRHNSRLKLLIMQLFKYCDSREDLQDLISQIREDYKGWAHGQRNP